VGFNQLVNKTKYARADATHIQAISHANIRCRSHDGNCQCVNCNGLEPHSPGIDPVGLSKEVRASVGDKEHGQHQHFVVLSLRPGALKQLLLVFKST
jgi:hypothetical protein